MLSLLCSCSKFWFCYPDKAWVSSQHSWGLLESVSWLALCGNKCLHRSGCQENSWKEESPRGWLWELLKETKLLRLPCRDRAPCPRGLPSVTSDNLRCDWWLPYIHLSLENGPATKDRVYTKGNICKWRLTFSPVVCVSIQSPRHFANRVTGSDAS